MEIENGAARGVLLPVLPGSESFDNSILPPLQNMYMYEESKQSFRYNSAFLIKNTTLQERYEAFRTERRGMGYSEEELEESYGFLLFDDKNKANKLGETGVIPGYSTCSTLGDPSKGVYVSKYSDCLDLNRWYHGKSGYIAIIRLTKGRVRDVTENYTVNYTPPSNGFDCHVSEQLSAVSANTSSFLAFERTQYYMYELPGGGADSTVQPPSHACPFAIVAFSYWDTKTPASEDQEKSEEEKTVFHYYPWRGQLQISSQVYHVGLKSSTGPLIPAKLPTVMAVDRAIKMSDLRQKLPKAMFETCFIGEVSLEGMGWSLYELAPSEAEDTSLSQLTQELKEKDLALVIQLNDSGFLILLHSSHFLTYEDAGSNKPEVLQGMFVFPDSRAIQRDTKICSKNPSLSPEGLQVVPALNYAETEVEKCLPEQSGELRGLLEQHIQSYAALIHPGLTISPSREASIFPDQFDVPDALKYLYSTPKWTEMGWKCLKSYFHQPGSFELSVSRATELLAAGREERGDEPDDDVYYCLSSPEGPPMTPASLGGPEEEQSGGQSPGDTATYISNAPAVSTEDFEKPGMTKADSNAPNKRVVEEMTLSSKEVQDVQPEEVQEEVPSDLTKPATPAGDFGKPVLKKADSNAPGTTLIPKEVQKELPYDLSQPVVLADDSGKPGKNKAVPGVGVEDEGTHLNAEEVQVDRQKEVKEDMLSDLSQPAENLRKAGPAALGKADCKAPEVGVANEGTNLHLKEVQKDMPSGLSQPAVSQEELKKPGPALATKPNIKAVETGVEDKGADLPKKEVQEEVPCDLSQFAVSANVFAIAGMTVMTKATEVTEVSTSPASGDLPTVLVITATEGTATVVPHNENFGLINTESITKNSSSLPPAKVQERGGSALNGQRGKANEVNNLSTSDWRKRPRKRRRFSGLGKRVLRSSAADFEEEETEKGCLDSSKVYSLKNRKEMTDLVQLNPWKKKERMDVTQVRPLKMQRELMNLIQDLPLKKKKESKDSMNFYPFKRKESVDLIHDGHPLKKKTDRWDLKAIISECGRIFVPHGSEVIAKDIESLKVMGKVIDHKQCADEMMVEACIKVPQPIETGDEPGLELIKSDENKDPHIWSSDSKDHPPEVKMADVDKMASQKSSELVQNKDMDFPSLEKHKKNSQFVAISLSKLKTVFSRRGKKKTPLKPVSEDQMLALDKKSKADAGMESVHFSHSCKDTPDRTTGAAEVAKEQTFGLDPKFALALGLTPRELHNNAPKSPEKSDIPLKQDIQSRLDLVTPQATSDQMSEALPSSPSATITLTGRGSPLQMKCKPADSIRKKWWLHYHTPTSFEKEKVAQPISSQLLTLNPDARRVVSRGRPRTVKKDTSDASCPPADALTLLADLALSTSNDKVLEQQPDHLALQQQECCPSLLISDNSVKDGGSPHESDGEPESVLHALLKHPSVARLKLPPQSPSPKGLVVGSGERVVLVSQEHSYSLPPSSSLLLGLSGSTLQVPISEGLQPHRKDMVYGDRTQALRAFLCQEQDQNRKELGKESGVAPESMRKGIGRRQKFRRLRRFIEKDRSVQVTRLWKENYDFNSDSKFTNDPMDKTVIRALHGPWDFNIEDTNEQVQLIIHMWIGLFYSRSTARFFQADPSLLCMEEKYSTEVDHGMVQAQVTSETKTSSPAYIALSKITEPEVLDRSNVGKKESQPLSLEPEALDLSVKTTSTVLDFTVDTKDSPESKQRIDLKSPSVYQPESGLHKEIISFHKQSTGLELKVYRDREDSMTSDKTSELDDDETNTHDNDSNVTLQNDVSPKRRNLESDGSYIILCEQAASVYINHEKVLETQIIDRGLEGKAKKEIQKEERSLDGEQNIARQDNDSVKTMSCTEVLGDGDLTNMADRVERNASEPRDGSYVAESKMHKAYPSVEDSVEAAKPEAVHVGKDTTNKEINAQPAGNDSIGEMFRIVSKATESVSRCPTPIVDDGYIPIPDIDSGCLVNCNASGVGKPLSRCPTPTQDEPPFVTELSYDHHTPKTVFLPDSKDANSPNLNSGFALIENEKAYCEPHEPSLGSSPSSVENMLHELRKSSNNNSKPNNLEAIGNQFSQLWTEPRKKPIATSTPLNTPYTSSKEKNDYSPYSNMRLTPAEQDLYALSSHDSLHRFPASYPKTHSTLTQKAAFSVPSTHLEILSNDTTERILTRDLSEIALEGDTNLCPASTEIIIQSIRQNIPGVSGPTAASQNLSGPNFTEPHPYSQQLAMAVNLSKSEGSRGEYSWKEAQTNIDPMSSDVVKSKQTAAPVHSNTNPHLYNTPYVTEMRRQIASLQDYVMDESEEPAVEQDNIESSLETNWISDDQHASNTSQLNKTKLDFINSLREYQQWDKGEFDDVLDFSKQGTSSSVTFQSEESDKIFTRMEENKQDWLKYCRSERSGNTSKSQIDLDDEHEEVSSFAKPCLVTVLDHKGNRITYENYPVLKPSTSTHTWTAPNSNRQGSSSFLEFSKRWDDTHNTDESDLTQSSVDLETLIFSERMNQMLKRKRKSSSSRYNRSKHHRSTVEERASSCSPAVTVHFSSLQEQESSEEHWEGLPSLAGQKLKIDMPERKGMPEETDRDMPQHLQKLSYTKGSEMTHVNVSDLVAESFKAYHAMMTEVCAGRKYPHRTERLKREEAKRNSLPKSRAPSKDKDFCGQMKKDMYDSLHDNLNSVVKQSCKNKFRFYILVTSDDPFFNETKELLEAEGHITVEQSQFCLGKDSPSSPLYIILRNEDIAEHICEVPHLLELKKSQNVLFAGIDRPDDIVNLTHQELFSKGGFVVFEGAALDTLSLSNIKKMSGFLEGLSKKGKWKWLLHYKDSRKLKESARSSAEAQGKKSFMDNCQEAGMVEVLPYHECDVISRTRPNYLHCLVRLQVQNVSARLPVFITDTTADKAFAKHGIFTMNINSFLLISQSDTCTIS
ncbi:protein TASOR 2-like isoform X3 [Oncorhynchus clarkii lewisi]|uniref:protein TASOR 2-like isoform X3 n=1 Tax=Oncorhynchus clarkii lewisi TaxID=490388 RepID=UPI0039B9557D